MNKVTKTWINFYAPGSFTANEWTKDTPENTSPDDVEWPDNAYAFTLHRRVDIVDGGETYNGKPEQIGPMYYHPDSATETLEEVKQNPSATSILVGNMECNRWERIVWTRWGNWPQPFDSEKHRVLAA